VIIATGPSGRVCVPAAWAELTRGALPIDAVQSGLMAAEADPACIDIGFGGRPDADGWMSLDAAIMDGLRHRSGAVAGLKGCKHPVAVARRVMEGTPHVMLVGEGARKFANAEGFPEEGPLLTDDARAAYEKFLAGEARPTFTGHSHDTVGCCALAPSGDLAVGCSTSGLDFKLPGRVGDSPIVGSGLYVDNGVGAAACMGMGEQMAQTCLAYRVVASMERGLSPQEATEEAVTFLLARRPGVMGIHCCVVSLRKDGAHGAATSYDTDVCWRASAADGGPVEFKPAQVSGLPAA
jgi:L-asparaginase/N4-(beta-N-acetylglucosaminyl)-L-asparaginase